MAPTFLGGAIQNSEGLTTIADGKFADVKEYVLDINSSNYVALMNDDSVVAWGGNTNYADSDNYVDYASAGLTDVKQIFMSRGGDGSNVALRNDGSLTFWGKKSTSDSNYEVLMSVQGKTMQRVDGSLETIFDGSEPSKTIVEMQVSDISSSYSSWTGVRTAYSVKWIALMADGSVSLIGSFDKDRYNVHHAQRYLAKQNDGKDYSSAE